MNKIDELVNSKYPGKNEITYEEFYELMKFA